jgi:hypothetical protein
MTNLRAIHSLLTSVFHQKDCIEGRPVRTFYKDRRVHCFAPFFFLTCDCEGNMYPCDYLQADTRLWNGRYERMRNEFCLGNVLDNSDIVLKRLATMMRRRVRELPCNGYDECGCCTRFCQLNASLNDLNNSMGEGPVTADRVRTHLAQPDCNRTGLGFL